jgi:hypothetical protein
MDIIRTHREGKPLNTLEKYYTYKISKNKLQMKDANIDTRNVIFTAIQSTAGNEHQLAAQKPYMLYRANYTETLRTATRSRKGLNQ